MEPTRRRTTRTAKSRRSRRLPLATLAVTGTVALAGCGGASATSAKPISNPSTTTAPAAARADVGIVNFKFTPAAITVRAGTTVVWTNKDTIAHSVNFATGGVDSDVLDRGEQFTHAFTTPGTYQYICSIHPFMHGTVIVTP